MTSVEPNYTALINLDKNQDCSNLDIILLWDFYLRIQIKYTYKEDSDSMEIP